VFQIVVLSILFSTEERGKNKLQLVKWIFFDIARSMDGGQSGATRRRSFGILRSLNKNDNHLDALAEEIEMHQQLSDSSGSSRSYVEEGIFDKHRGSWPTVTQILVL